MKNRNIALYIILTLVTCGIYSLFWNVNLNNDFAEHNGKEKNGWMIILLSIITCGIYYFVWIYRMGEEIEKAGGKNEGIVYLLLSLFGFGIIAMALIQHQENELCPKIENL